MSRRSSASPSSLLNWMRRMIGVRKQHTAFGRGALRFLYPRNRKILAYRARARGRAHPVRRQPRRARRRRSSSTCREFRGAVPVELTGGAAFPPVGDLPYMLTLPAYGFFWFVLATEGGAPRWHVAPPEPLPEFVTLVATDGWQGVLEGRSRDTLERHALPEFLMRQRWFGAKDLPKTSVALRPVATLAGRSEQYPLTVCEVTSECSEPQHYLLPTGVVLQCDRVVGGGREFRADGAAWVLDVPRPAVQRLEYRFAVARGDEVEVVLDPSNPVTVRTAFGDRSVLEMPGYAPPWWLQAPAVEGRMESMSLAGETSDAVPVTVWSPVELPDDEPAPMLLVHDGAEYDQLARITTYSAALVAGGQLPQHRVALAHPVMRDAWYSGSPQYLRTIADAGLDRLGERYAVRAPGVVVGASLGGLTALLLGLLADAPGRRGATRSRGRSSRCATTTQECGYRYFGRISRPCRRARHAARRAAR